MLGLYAAITRQDPSGQPPQGWAPEERLTRAEALRSFTLDAAYAAHAETRTGSLEAGKLADLVILSHDVMTVAAARHPRRPACSSPSSAARSSTTPPSRRPDDRDHPRLRSSSPRAPRRHRRARLRALRLAAVASPDRLVAELRLAQVAALVLALIAGVSIGLIVNQGERPGLTLELALGLAFFIAASVAPFRDPREALTILALAFAAHAIADVLHRPGLLVDGMAPQWYIVGCALRRRRARGALLSARASALTPIAGVASVRSCLVGDRHHALTLARRRPRAARRQRPRPPARWTRRNRRGWCVFISIDQMRSDYIDKLRRALDRRAAPAGDRGRPLHPGGVSVPQHRDLRRPRDDVDRHGPVDPRHGAERLVGSRGWQGRRLHGRCLGAGDQLSHAGHEDSAATAPACCAPTPSPTSCAGRRRVRPTSSPCR